MSPPFFCKPYIRSGPEMLHQDGVLDLRRVRLGGL